MTLRQSQLKYEPRSSISDNFSVRDQLWLLNLSKRKTKPINNQLYSAYIHG